MKFAYKVWAFLLLTSIHIYSAELEEKSNLDEFINSYYMQPKPQDAVKFLKIYSAFAADSPNGQAPLNVFFTRILQDNPNLKNGFSKVINSAPENAKAALIVILRADHERLLAEFPPSPGRNDALWGSFFSTGNDKYLQELFMAAERGMDLKSLNEYLIGASAQWSICSNAKNHKQIRQFLKTKSGNLKDKNLAESLLSGDPGEYRAKMIATIRKQREKGLW